MMIKLSDAAEDYLKAIYELTSEGGSASTNAIASHLGVTPPSVTGMLQKLAASAPPLVTYHKSRGVRLTPEGERVALEMLRHHRLVELFLQKSLGLTWDEVHPEAERLEHVLSDELEERISVALGNPSRDPHGDPIPDRELRLPPSSQVRLSELRPGQSARVQRVRSSDPGLLRYLAGLGLTPEIAVRVMSYSPFDGNLSVLIDAQEGAVVLGPAVTSQVFVEVTA